MPFCWAMGLPHRRWEPRSGPMQSPGRLCTSSEKRSPGSEYVLIWPDSVYDLDTFVLGVLRARGCIPGSRLDAGPANFQPRRQGTRPLVQLGDSVYLTFSTVQDPYCLECDGRRVSSQRTTLFPVCVSG